MTPEGHPFAGFITFSAHDEEWDHHGPGPAFDPIQRPDVRGRHAAFGSRAENKMWQHTLRSLADYLGSSAPVETKIVCVDKKRQWKNFRNVRYNGLALGQAPDPRTQGSCAGCTGIWAQRIRQFSRPG